MWTWSYVHSILWCNNSHIWNWVTSLWEENWFNLLNDEYFTIPYILDTILNSPAVHQLPTWDKKILFIIVINGENTITSKVTLDELPCYQTQREKSKVIISLCRNKSYQQTDLEDIWSRFDQFRPVVLHLESCLPDKPLYPNKIGEAFTFPQRQLWEEDLFLQYDRKKNVSLFLATITIKNLPEVTKVIRSLIAPIIKEGDYSDTWKFVARHCANGSYQIKVIYFDK